MLAKNKKKRKLKWTSAVLSMPYASQTRDLTHFSVSFDERPYVIPKFSLNSFLNACRHLAFNGVAFSGAIESISQNWKTCNAKKTAPHEIVFEPKWLRGFRTNTSKTRNPPRPLASRRVDPSRRLQVNQILRIQITIHQV